MLPAPKNIRGLYNNSPLLDYLKGQEFLKSRQSQANTTTDPETSLKHPGAAEEGEKTPTYEIKSLNFINPERFIV